MMHNHRELLREGTNRARILISSSGENSVIAGLLLAALPLCSFAAQYFFSLKAGTQALMVRHLTVMIVDWIFVPFNFFVVRVIDWGRGRTLYLITCISIALNVLVHAVWQYNGVDFGHMITKKGVVLPAGWVHLAFSSAEMILLTAFVFCRRPAADVRITTALAATYLVLTGISGYYMHQEFITSDIVVSVSGLICLLLYPLLRHPRESPAGPQTLPGRRTQTPRC